MDNSFSLSKIKQLIKEVKQLRQKTYLLYKPTPQQIEEFKFNKLGIVLKEENEVNDDDREKIKRTGQ